MVTCPSGTVGTLLNSDLVTPVTRAALRGRLSAETAPAAPHFFDLPTYATLEALCARLIPQPERALPVQLAGDIDRRLANGETDGWRYADMPRDGEAYTRGLRALDAEAQNRFARAGLDSRSLCRRRARGEGLPSPRWRGVAKGGRGCQQCASPLAEGVRCPKVFLTLSTANLVTTITRATSTAGRSAQTEADYDRNAARFHVRHRH